MGRGQYYMTDGATRAEVAANSRIGCILEYPKTTTLGNWSADILVQCR